MDDFEKAVLDFIKGDPEPKYIEIEEKLEDEFYGGDEADFPGRTVDVYYSDIRRESGWFGSQKEGTKYMKRDSAKVAITAKVWNDCEPSQRSTINLESTGLYKFTNLHTNESYIGKAEEQPLLNRIIQHLLDAMSDKPLTGIFDQVLRYNNKAENWRLQVWAMPKDRVAAAEKIFIRRFQPEYNVRLKD